MYTGIIVIGAVSVLVFGLYIGINWFLVRWGVVGWSSMVDWGVVNRSSMVDWGNLVSRRGVICRSMSYGMAVSSRVSMFN